MAVIRSYNQPTVEARPAPNAGIPMNAPVGAFGSAAQTEGDARASMQAGAFLERAADTTGNMALSMMEEANEARVQELANGFMSGTQFTLYTDKDAFYRKRGQDAINGAQQATDKLLELKKESLGLATNDTQRRRLDKMLSAQIMDATNGISRHVSTQAVEWQKNVADGKLQLLRNEAALSYNDGEKLEKLAIGAEETARQKAKLAGVTGTESETAMVASARSDVYATAITQMIQNGQNRSALALHDKVAKQLDEKDSIKLASAIKSVRTDVDAEDWISRNLPNEGRREVRRFFEAKGYSPEAASALAGHAQAESQFRPNATNPKDGRDGSDSIGLFQWNSDRAKALQKFAADNKMDPRSRTTQLEFAAWELENTEGPAGKKIKGAKTLEEANQAVFSYLRPAKQSGRLDFTQAAFNDGVGFDKANAQGVIMAALNDPSLPQAVKASIATKLNKESSNLEATRSAQIKGLDDTLEATTQAMIASPGSYKKGTLGDIADGYEAAGERSKAMNVRLLANMEDTLLSFAQSPKSAQEESMRTVAAALLPGKGKALADSLIAVSKKDAADAVKAAGEDFSALKTAATNGVRMATMETKARSIVDGFIKGGDFAKAREAADFFDAQVNAQGAGQAPPAQLSVAISEMKARVEGGEQTNTSIRQLDAMRDVQKRQEAAFSKDALAAGADVYGADLGPLPPATDFAGRVAYAEQISRRQGGLKVLPFTEPEIVQIRTTLENAPPEQQAKTMQALSQIPAEHIPGIATALAGKGAGDQLSRSYAAALSFYADRDPASREIGNQILQGARIIKEGGDGSRKPAVTSDAWQAQMQDRVGNLLRDADPRQMGVISDAVASVYVYQMNRAGRQGEKTDTDILNSAIKAVVGEPVVRNGQAFLPPVRGMTSYDVDKALRSLSDGDLAGLQTMEGTPITADVIQRRGALTNGRNGEGWYFVRIPDPRAGGDLQPVVNADGSPFQLDLRPLMERAARFPEGMAPLPDAAIRARSRAPANPTEGLVP
tara:strand:- start:37169 stop:40201 length:3033 start_codon:yes stop_codon:yes gene_type:complete